jgi:replication factor C subunit 1
MSLIEKYSAKTLEDLIDKQEYIEYIQIWIKQFYSTAITNVTNVKKKKKIKSAYKSCLLITGNYGVGKTVLVKILFDYLQFKCLQLEHIFSKDIDNIKEKIIEYIYSSNIVDIFNNNENKNKVILIDELESTHLLNFKNNILNLVKMNNDNFMIPIIIITNNQHSKILSDLKKYCDHIEIESFKQTSLNEFIENIIKKENIILEDVSIVDEIVNFCKRDFRKILTILSDIIQIYKDEIITYEKIKIYFQTSEEKLIDFSLFQATQDILYNNMKIKDIMKYYEYEKVKLPLMVHQNYINLFSKEDVNSYNTIEHISELLSKSDIIENFIYGEQYWDMNYLHSLYSCVLPSYLLQKVKKKKTKIQFTYDLNKTSIKNINKRNITNLNKKINKNVTEYLILGTIIKNLIKNKRKDVIQELMIKYNLRVNDMELILKIDKIELNEIQSLKFYLN